MVWWRRKRELEEEIAAHVEMAMADRMARGEDPETARREAEREFGNAALVKDVTAETWRWRWLDQLLQDVRYALRQMKKSPGFALTVIGTLALGIGAAVAMFTVVDKVMLRPLPYRDAGRLASIEFESKQVAPPWGVPLLDIQEWRKWDRSFSEIGYYVGLGGRNYLEGSNGSQQVMATIISANLLDLLGVKPMLGRGFSPQADSFAKSGDADAILLGNTAWRQMFGADPKLLGKTVKISGKSHTVVGIMPPGFAFPFAGSAPEVWMPAQPGPADGGRTSSTPGYEVIGRLRRGVTPARATTELNVLQKQIAKGYVDKDARETHSRFRISTYGDTLVDADTKHALLALLAASGLLWLIACVNSTNLLLARAMARQREIAVRGALGAGRWRIVQQLMMEGLLLSSSATLIGSAIAWMAVKLFARSLSKMLPLPVSAAPNGLLPLALVLLTLVSALAASVWPAVLAAYSPIEPALKQGGQQSGTSRARSRLRSGLVVTEIALSLTLLVSCGLLLRTIYALRHVQLGFRTEHIFVASMNIPGYKFEGKNLTSDLYEPLLERVRHMPGVEAAGLISEVPLGKTFRIQLTLNGNAADELDNAPKTVNAQLIGVSPEMQGVFGFKMAAGRFFNSQDTATTTPVMVINRAFARLYYSNNKDMRKIIGKKLWHLEPGKPAEIIGVLDDVRQAGITLKPSPEVDLDIAQLGPKSTAYEAMEGMAMDLAVRTDRSEASFLPELREVLRQADPALAGSTMSTMDQVVEDSYGSQRMAAHVLEIFAGSALLLCVAGLYGLLAYVVTQRTREIGLRIALGAQRGDVLWLVMRQATWMLAAGVAIGLGAAYASTRLIGSFLYGVRAHDGATFAAVALVLLAAGAVAAYLPARRAAGVDPMEALRAE